MNINKRYTFVPLALMFLVAGASAAPRSKTQMKAVAIKLLGSTRMKAAARGSFSIDTKAIKELKVSEGYVVYGSEGNGFAVIATDDTSPAILGYSDTKFEPKSANPNFEWWLSMVNEAVVSRAKESKMALVNKMPSGYG